MEGCGSQVAGGFRAGVRVIRLGLLSNSDCSRKPMPSNRFRAVQNVKIEGENSPGDSGNCPGVWPHLNERHDVSEHIPNTQLTDKLRALWEVLQHLCDEPPQSFEDYYREQCAGGSDNGRALAALLFYRAREYWPEYFCPSDLPAVAAWGSMLDDYPILTPDVIELAVDKVHSAGIGRPQPANFIRMARFLSGEVLN